MLSVGFAYLTGDIAFSSDINEYINPSGLMAVYVIGGLAIAVIYVCWYVFRRENRYLDILLPVCVLFVWGLARRKVLYAGGKGMIYSIAYQLRKSYGIKTGLVDMDYVSMSAIAEFVLLVVAVSMFFSVYMIYRCNSLMIAVGLAFMYVAAGAALSVRVSTQGVILVAFALIIVRYALVRNGQPTSPLWNVAVPLVVFAGCLIAALMVYEGAYERGVKAQGRLLEMVDNMEYFIMGDSGKGYSNYYKVDDQAVNPSDDVVDELTRKEKPEGNLYVKIRSYVTYENGVWRGRDIGYSHDSDILVNYDKDRFDRYAADIRALTGGDTEYSQDVADDVTEYIRSHISYTTSPDKFSGDADPIMYALYEGHQGYCVHYASAAAIGMRTVGIPTRYNTGYVIPSSAWIQQDDGTYRAMILEKYSHAWAEAYNASTDAWDIVDATPLGDRADTLGIPDEPDMPGGNDTQSPDDENPVTDESEDTSEDTQTETTTEEVSTEQTTNVTETSQSVTTENEGQGDGTSTETQISGGGDGQASGDGAGDGAGSSGLRSLWGNKYVYTALVILLVCAVFMAVLVVRRRTIIGRRRHRMLGHNRILAIHEMSAAIYDMLKFSGMAADVSENDTEYAEIVTENCSMIKGDEFKYFVAVVQAAVYGGISPDDAQMRAAGKLYNKVRAYGYWSLNFKKKCVWLFVKCYDVPSHRKKHVRKE